MPSDFGMQYTEENLKTKDGINLKSYIILQPNTEEAKRSPTILYFHVSFWKKRKNHKFSTLFNRQTQEIW